MKSETLPDPQHVIEQVAHKVRQLLEHDASGHDWWHIERVRHVALQLAQKEGADAFVVELAALLHDIGDWKNQTDGQDRGAELSRVWLEEFGLSPETVQHVADIIEGISFKGAGVATEMPTLEGKCVQDADRLDAIGAIGIGRAFAFGGSRGRPMHDPEVKPELHQSFEDYKRKSGATLNHFTEKLLLLKERMQTPSGRVWAEQRHQFTEEFYNRFLAEWDSRDMA
ncbi:metal-dependent phosphohydrolase HD sub domain protein [Planctopirus limnophila DSM 3776]|uniref:Metal-dependent phosphohydrolase HD sub domain protein n=1 Tax=Planctopirus limnophila (strain ATCC 43296 / DSM 3776 / IFAM 1008 / Mu 290) TaxID=521674 RepID=D5SSA3_PLAL2|nr:HD domain-containing protein [Planctopirus limnophila]ADG68827.1 metal-dependent phosphohydrolase HD sub domain protein [Planctopirus limnophila DSM 3776]